jgi:hypothetical protein
MARSSRVLNLTVPLLGIVSLGIAYGQGITDRPNPGATLYCQNCVEPQDQSPEEDSPDCETKMRNFVTRLDIIFASDTHEIDPMLLLLKQSFPMKHCNINQVLEICKHSMFFWNVSDAPKHYHFAFTSRGYRLFYPGFAVTFALEKKSGNSSFPFAQVNSLWGY